MSVIKPLVNIVAKDRRSEMTTCSSSSSNTLLYLAEKDRFKWHKILKRHILSRPRMCTFAPHIFTPRFLLYFLINGSIICPCSFGQHVSHNVVKWKGNITLVLLAGYSRHSYRGYGVYSYGNCCQTLYISKPSIIPHCTTFAFAIVPK